MADTRRGFGRSEDQTGPEPDISIRDFTGMAPNRDPHDLPIGKSIHQLNVGVGPQGELRVRLGAKVVQFD